MPRQATECVSCGVFRLNDAEIHRHHDVIVRPAPVVEDIHGTGADPANVHEDAFGFVLIDDLLDPVRAGDDIELVAAFDFANLAAAAPGETESVVSESRRI